MKNTLILLSLVISQLLFAQKFENLAPTPPLGWNSWNTFGTDINEKLVKDIADVFVSKGLKEAGYEYIVLDDGWMAKERDSLGNLVPDPIKFPNGLKPVVDYVHSKGLKFGLYNCAGDKTCAGYPGSRGHEFQDALLYANLGVDYLKYDWCNTGKINAEEAYKTMRDALFAAQRPIVFSICEWGDNEPWKWGKDIGHLWRISGDITDCWNCELDHGTWSSWGVLKILDMHKVKRLRQFSGPEHWNDLDMMEVGNGMNTEEDRSHFALWCMLASPLIMGNDLRTASETTIQLLTNKELIAINQDKTGKQAFPFYSEGELQIWLKTLSNGEWAMCFLNRGDVALNLEFDWNEHNMIEDNYTSSYLNTKDHNFKVRDATFHKDLGTTKDIIKKKLAPHDVLVIRLRK